MKRLIRTYSLLATLTLTTGCRETPPPAASTNASDSQGHEPGDVASHEHADGAEHSHGEGHSHDNAPHGGTLIDWGGGAYHVEFTVDHDRKEAIVYIVGSDAESPLPIKADKILLVIDDPMTEMELVAQPLDGEAEGTSSRFVGTHDTIGIVKEFSGTISGEIEGTPYTGDFKEESHDADHEH